MRRGPRSYQYRVKYERRGPAGANLPPGFSFSSPSVISKSTDRYPSGHLAVILNVGLAVTAQEAFDSYHRAVFSFCRRLTHRADLAEDITQECFLTYVRAPERFDRAKGTLGAYLFAIARNLALKHYRDHSVECQLDNDHWTVAADPRPGMEASAAVERAVAALPMLEKEALILFQYEGLTLVQIGQVVGADVGTVKGRLHRARGRLRTALAPYRRVGECNGVE
jgi:RNA polymerase sigma factor (sigma-70 family)